MIVSQLLAVVGLFALSAYYWHRRRLYLLAWQLNGPTGYPLIGAAHLFFDATSKRKTTLSLILKPVQTSDIVFALIC